jgi:hypothetical protein
MTDSAALLPGTLDLLILKAVSLGKLHGYGVLLRIEQISGGALQIQQGALYPALYRLEHQGLIESEWGSPRTTAAPSSTASPPPAARASARRSRAGTGWRTPSRWRCAPDPRRSEHDGLCSPACAPTRASCGTRKR